MPKETKTVIQTQGTGVLGFLTIIFVVAKLTGYITWSWWIVLLPLYGGLALMLAVMLVFGVVAVIALGIAALLK